MEEKLVEILDKLEGLATSYAPDVWQLALATAQAKGIGYIITGLVMLLIGGIMLRLGLRLWRHAQVLKKEHGSLSSRGDGEMGWSITLLILGGIVALSSTLFFLDPWAWIAAFNPKLYLAKEILGL